jgi:hypothetical protein
MRDKDLQVVEITLAVVAPGPGEKLFQIRMTALLLPHLDGAGILPDLSNLTT